MTDSSQYIRFDWAIKRILRDKANFEVLEGLMTVLIGQPIRIIEILESESNADSREDKYNRVDVKAKTESGEMIIVEVQLTKESDYYQCILFGTATAIREQTGRGRSYDAIKKVYSINILYFDFGEGDDYAYHGVTIFRGMTNKEAVLQLRTDNERTYMEKETHRMTAPEEVFPEYFLLIVGRFNEVAKTPIEEWMAYLKDGVIKDNTETPGLQVAREKLAYMSMTDKERREYDAYMVSVHAAKDAYDTARSDGYVDGFSEGMEKGMENVARKMKARNMPLEVIAEMTGLSADAIAKL